MEYDQGNYLISIVGPFGHQPAQVEVYERLELKNPFPHEHDVLHVRFVGDFPLRTGVHGKHIRTLDEILERVKTMVQPAQPTKE